MKREVPFVWQPGQGPDQAALARLRAHFPRPREVMGEAWFMGGERHMYQELSSDISSLSLQELTRPLEAIASGTMNFGQFKEWDDWYHFLLAELLPRNHEGHWESFLEYLMTGFFALYPHGMQAAPYKDFAADAMAMLGRCLMMPQRWDGENMVVDTPSPSRDGLMPLWRDWDRSNDIYVSLFFCVKYLPGDQLEAWLRSVCAIRSSYWRAQVMVWLVGAHGLLNGEIFWPSELPGQGWPSVDWAWSHCLKPQTDTLILPEANAGNVGQEPGFLPQDSRNAALAFIRDYFSETMYLEWLADIDRRPDVAKALYDVPQRFEDLYLRSPVATYPL